MKKTVVVTGASSGIGALGAERIKEADPEATGSHDAEIAALDRARHLLAQLPDAERDAVYLTAVVGMNGPEAAAALGCSPSAITTRISRARARLRELLATEAQHDHH